RPPCPSLPVGVPTRWGKVRCWRRPWWPINSPLPNCCWATRRLAGPTSWPPMRSTAAGCSPPSNCLRILTRGNVPSMPIGAKPSSCSSSASSKPVPSKPAPRKAWRARAPLSSPVCGSIKCFFWTTIGITDLSLTSKRSSMKGGGALLPELCAGFKLLEQVRAAIRLRHYSLRTEETYVHWIKRFILFHGKRHPGEMEEQEIAQFLTALAVDGHVSASTQNQALNALVFLYRHVLKLDVGRLENIVRAKQPQRLPVVLRKHEVKALLDALEGVHWLMGHLLYGAGLRLLECLRLRVKDIDFGANHIVVRAGKGNKDRLTMLPLTVKTALAAHLIQVRELHQHDLAHGLGSVYLPDALHRKYPH